MSKGNRFGYAALGLVAGVGLALLFLVWAVPGFRDPANSEIGQPDSHGPADGENQPIEPSSLWDIHTSPEDTYAQWIAAVAALTSIGVSIWAVRLVRDTLQTSRQAIAVTRDVGQRQLRAYIVPKSCEVWVDGAGQPKSRVYLENCGQTPAENVVIGGRIFFFSEPLRVGILIGEDADRIPKETLGAKAETTFDPQQSLLEGETIDTLQKDGKYLYVAGWVEYTDIFKWRWKRKFSFRATDPISWPIPHTILSPDMVVMGEHRIPNPEGETDA